MTDSPLATTWIIAPTILPAITAAIMILMQRRDIEVQRFLSVASTAALLGVALFLYDAVGDGETDAYRLGAWPAPFGIVLVIDRLSTTMLVLTAGLALAEAELARTSANISDTHDLVVTQAVELFKRGGGQLQVTFDYDTVQEAAVAVKYGSALLAETNKSLDFLEELRNQELQQVDLIEDQKATLQGHLDRLAIALEGAETQRQIIEENRKQIEAELINQQALLQTIKNEAAALDLELEGLEAEQAKVEEIIAEAQRSGGVAPGTLYTPLKPFRIVSSYGPRLHPILGYTRTHAGIDLNGYTGQEIYAADSGRVIYAGVRGGYGNTVIIDHGGGLATLYAHQSSIAVRNGVNVTVGDVIGYVGSTGLSTGPHLHFEVRINGAHTDPAPYFQ